MPITRNQLRHGYGGKGVAGPNTFYVVAYKDIPQHKQKKGTHTQKQCGVYNLARATKTTHGSQWGAISYVIMEIQEQTPQCLNSSSSSTTVLSLKKEKNLQP